MEEKKSNYYLYAIGVLILLLVVVYIWKTAVVRNTEKRLTEHYQKVITSRTEGLLRMTAIPFSWAVRKEMIRENYDQINEYLIRFVKEPMVKQILVVKSDGIVAVSTDKKLEGMSFSSLYPTQTLNQDEISATSAEDGNIVVVAPIMGLNARLGFIYMIYMPEKISRE